MRTTSVSETVVAMISILSNIVYNEESQRASWPGVLLVDGEVNVCFCSLISLLDTVCFRKRRISLGYALLHRPPTNRQLEQVGCDAQLFHLGPLTLKVAARVWLCLIEGNVEESDTRARKMIPLNAVSVLGTAFGYSCRNLITRSQSVFQYIPLSLSWFCTRSLSTVGWRNLKPWPHFFKPVNPDRGSNSNISKPCQSLSEVRTTLNKCSSGWLYGGATSSNNFRSWYCGGRRGVASMVGNMWLAGKPLDTRLGILDSQNIKCERSSIINTTHTPSSV